VLERLQQMFSAATAFANSYILDTSASVEALADAALNANLRNGRSPTSDDLECFKPIVLLRDSAAEADQTFALGLLRRLNAALVAATDRYAVIVSFGSTEEMGVGVQRTERGSSTVVLDSSSPTDSSVSRYEIMWP
jgi:hypothetical protein